MAPQLFRILKKKGGDADDDDFSSDVINDFVCDAQDGLMSALHQDDVYLADGHLELS